MKLAELLTGIKSVENSIREPLEITSLCYDSRKIEAGGLFFALKGVKSDGHDYLEQVWKNGAAAAVVSEISNLPDDMPYIRVKNVRSAMAKASAAFYGSITSKLPLIGVTGTNGKTTTTYLLESIFESAGFHPAVLGTISYRYGTVSIDASHTTPESPELQQNFRRLRDAGADSFVMEVSSHSLEQNRVDGCSFDAAIFTNLTRDHLDYHGTMESYLESKKRLFTELLAEGAGKGVRSAVINIDDPASKELLSVIKTPVITFGVSKGDVAASDVVMSTDGLKGNIVTRCGEIPFESSLIGGYNLSNILGAAAAAIAFGLPQEAVAEGINKCSRVPGRVEPVENDLGITVLVDYAHTGDALENVLKTLVELKKRKIITLFGCGGDRDRGKRPVMGETAIKYSDLTIVTSDNPRTEDPLFIIEEILKGIEPLGAVKYDPEIPAKGVSGAREYCVEPDRRKAIRIAVNAAEEGDILLIAGKGHEDYQIVGTVKHHFDDREEAVKALKARATGNE